MKMEKNKKIMFWDDIPSRFSRRNNILFEINMLIIEIVKDKEFTLDEKCILVGRIREAFKFKGALLLELRKNE